MAQAETERQKPTAAAPPPIKTSLSESRSRKPKDTSPFSAKSLASLQQFLDHDYLNFWDIRRCGNNLGLLIRCAVCGTDPPKQKKGEDWVWYGYRKWRWMAEHLVSKHCRAAALAHRRIVAENKRIEDRRARKEPS